MMMDGTTRHLLAAIEKTRVLRVLIARKIESESDPERRELMRVVTDWCAVVDRALEDVVAEREAKRR